MLTDKLAQFFVLELQPFVTTPSVSRQPDGLQRQTVTAKVCREQTAACNDVTLYGSTQAAVDLAELAAEAGDVTLSVDDVGSSTCTQTRTFAAEMGEVATAANEHCEEKVRPTDASIALDGFCLQSPSVSSVHFTNTAPRYQL